MQRAGADARRRLEPAAHRRAGRDDATATRGVHVVQEGVEVPAGRSSSSRRVGTPSASWVEAPNDVGERGVVDEGDAGRGDLLSLAPDEERAALLHRLGRQRGADQRDRSSASPGGRAQRAAAATVVAWHRAAGPRAPPRRVPPPRGRGRRTARPMEKPPPVCVSVSSSAIAYAEHEQTVRRVRRLDTERVDDRALDRGVAVRRGAQRADPRVETFGRRLRARSRARPCRRSGP